MSENGYEIGVRKLTRKMHSLGMIWSTGNSRKEPTRKAIRSGYLDVRKSEFTDKYGTPRDTPTIIVTGKGRKYIWDILRTENQ